MLVGWFGRLEHCREDVKTVLLPFSLPGPRPRVGLSPRGKGKNDGKGNEGPSLSWCLAAAVELFLLPPARRNMQCAKVQTL